MEEIHEIKQLVPRKHIGKQMNNKQESIVEWIQQSQELRTMAEAKHEYFENQKKYDEEANIKEGRAVMETQGTPAQQIADAALKDEPKKKGPMTIAETKLGVTMVISKEDCETIGIAEHQTTKEAIQEIRHRLGFPTKKKQ